MEKLKEELRSRAEKSEPTVEVPTEEGTMEVPASQAVHHMQMQMLNQRISEAEKPEEKVTIPVGEEETAEVPVSQAPYMMQAQWAQAERKRTEKEYERLRDSYEELREQLTPEKMRERAEKMGYYRTESPSFELISSMREDFDTKADRLMDLLERQGPPTMGRRPTKEFEGGARYTPREREKKARRIQERLRGAEEQIGAEDEFIRAAHKVARSERREE